MYKQLSLYENFLHNFFYIKLNYSNRAVIHVNHTKIFIPENKVNYGNANNAAAFKSKVAYG